MHGSTHSTPDLASPAPPDSPSAGSPPAQARRKGKWLTRAGDPLFRLECATVLALVLPLVLLAAAVLHTRHLAITQNRAMVERLARTAHEHSLNSDTGSGIAPADLERVFDPFFTTKPAGSGTGLGLSQVQGLCVRAGGSVSIRSTPGTGTSVRLVFPALDARLQVVAQSTEPGDASRELDTDILLVEDNLEVASATMGLLRSAGGRITHCEHPAAALALLERQSFDAVLSDIVMPGEIDGIEFARVLRQRQPGLPVLLMTGYAQRIPEAERLGLAVLPKPVDPAALAARLRAMLQERGPQHEKG